MLTNIEVDTDKLNAHLRSLNDSNRDQWLKNVKYVLAAVSKYINGERYTEAAQLVFTVKTKFTIVVLISQHH